MFHDFHSQKASVIAAMHIRAETAKTDFSIDPDRSTVRFSAAKLPDTHERLNSGNSDCR